MIVINNLCGFSIYSEFVQLCVCVGNNYEKARSSGDVNC